VVLADVLVVRQGCGSTLASGSLSNKNNKRLFELSCAGATLKISAGINGVINGVRLDLFSLLTTHWSALWQRGGTPARERLDLRPEAIATQRLKLSYPGFFGQIVKSLIRAA
jgi:hypothetical protein